jgi:hypothetical protein
VSTKQLRGLLANSIANLRTDTVMMAKTKFQDIVNMTETKFQDIVNMTEPKFQDILQTIKIKNSNYSVQI